MSLDDQGASLLSDDGGAAAPQAAPSPASSAASSAAPSDDQGRPPANGAVPANGQPPNVTPAGDPWWKGMQTGLDQSEALSFRNMASRYKEPADFAKAHLELRKTAIIPPKDDKPEAWEQVWDRLGRPKDAKEYQLDFAGYQLGDGEKETAEQFKTVAHREGLLPRQVTALTKWQGELAKTQADAFQAKAQAIKADREKLVKAEWGQDYTAKKGAVLSGLKQVTSEQQLKAIATARLDDGTYVVDHPAFANVFASFGERLSEDSRDPLAFNTNAKESVQAEITRIETEAAQKGLSPVSPNYPHQQLNALYDKLYGTKPMQMGYGAR